MGVTDIAVVLVAVGGGGGFFCQKVVRGLFTRARECVILGVKSGM